MADIINAVSKIKKVCFSGISVYLLYTPVGYLIGGSMKDVCQHCTIREAHHSEELKKDFASRLNRIEGQIKGVKKMISENVYCDDILIQISAIQSAMSAVAQKLLSAHMKTCVVEQIKNDNLEVIDEVMKTIKRMTKSH
jgi:CsoR family transcriptional regulator, copper-sensing transcriptional repressor